MPVGRGAGLAADPLVITPMCLFFSLRGDKAECVRNTEQFAECLFIPEGEKMCVRVIRLASALFFSDFSLKCGEKDGRMSGEANLRVGKVGFWSEVVLCSPMIVGSLFHFVFSSPKLIFGKSFKKGGGAN